MKFKESSLSEATGSNLDIPNDCQGVPSILKRMPNDRNNY